MKRHFILLAATVLLGGVLQRPAAAQDTAQRHIERGDSLRNGPHGGNPAGAALEYRLALRLDPSSAEVHYDLANALRGSGDTEAAILEYQQAIHLDMPDPAGSARHPRQTAEAYRQLGVIRQAKNQLISATANFRASLRLEPNNPETHVDLAEALFGRDLYAAAIPEYQAALRLDPAGQHGVGPAATHNNLGVCNANLKNYSAALTEYRAVLRLMPNSYQPHCNLGTTLYQLKRYPEAIREFQEALWLNPQSTLARNNLGTALYESGQREAGRIEWRKVLRMGDPDQADVARELLGDSASNAVVSP